MFCVVGDHIGDQSRLARSVLTQQHRRILHARAGTQRGGDFAQFDAEPAQFHLVVVAAQILQRAIGAPAGDIAAAVHALAGVLCERIGDEAFGG